MPHASPFPGSYCSNHLTTHLQKGRKPASPLTLSRPRYLVMHVLGARETIHHVFLFWIYMLHLFYTANKSRAKKFRNPVHI